MVLAFIVSLFSLVVYFFGISSSVYGGDAGDITLASWFGGVAHPPGYPLNSMLGWVFTHLPYSASIAYKSNLMSAVCLALTIGFLYLTLKLLTKNIFVSLAASFVLAFTNLYMLYAHVTEVFQLNVLLVSVSVYYLFLWREKVFSKAKKKTYKDLYISILFLGLACFHHQTSLLLVPSYIYLILSSKIKFDKKETAKIIGVFFIGVLPYAFVFLAAYRNTPINWDNPVNLNNFLRLILRSDYGTFTTGINAIGITPFSRLVQVLSYLVFVKTDFTLFGVTLILGGFLYLWLKARTVFYFLISSIFFTGIFFLVYSSFILEDSFTFAIWERFLILNYFFLAIVIAYGMLFILDLIEKSQIFKKIHFRPKALLLSLVMFLLPFAFLVVNFPKANLSNFNLGNYLGYDILNSTKPNSLIVLFDDTAVFNTEYVYYTTKTFQDRKIVIAGTLRHKYARDKLMSRYPSLGFPSDYSTLGETSDITVVNNLMIANMQKWPVYTTGYAPKIANTHWEQSGLLLRLVPGKDKLISEDEENAILEKMKFKGEKSNYVQFLEDHIDSIYSLAYTGIASEYTSFGENNKAKDFLTSAIYLNPSNTQAFFGLGKIYQSESKCQKADSLFFEAFRVTSNKIEALQNLLDNAKNCSKDAKMSQKYQMQLDEQKKLLEGQLK